MNYTPLLPLLEDIAKELSYHRTGRILIEKFDPYVNDDIKANYPFWYITEHESSGETRIIFALEEPHKSKYNDWEMQVHIANHARRHQHIIRNRVEAYAAYNNLVLEYA